MKYTIFLIMALAVAAPSLAIAPIGSDAAWIVSGSNCTGSGSLVERFMQRGSYGIRNVDREERPFYLLCPLPVIEAWPILGDYELPFIRLGNDSSKIQEFICILQVANQDGNVVLKVNKVMQLDPGELQYAFWGWDNGGPDSFYMVMGETVNIVCKLPAGGRIIQYGM